jgi:hypothetical protein
MARDRTPILGWSAIAAVLATVQYVSNRLAGGFGLWPPPEGRALFAGWTQFDAWEFIHISRDGYWYRAGARAPTSFFPLYPLAIRALRPVVGDPVVAAVAVSAAAGLAATVLFWRWCQRVEVAAPARTGALALFLLYPWGWFLYGVPFSDSLFVALVIAALLLVERDRLVAAGLVGALATAARPTGVALVPALVLLALERAGALRPRLADATVRADADAGAGGGRLARWFDRLALPTELDRARLRPALAAPLLAVLGVGAYSAYLWVRFDGPLVWVTDQSQYNGTGIRTLLKAGLVSSWIHWTDPVHTVVITVQALLALGMLVAVPAVGRRFGWGYGALVLVLVALPSLATRDFNSTGRYLLAAFPVFAVAAERLADRPVLRRGWLVACAVGVVALNASFARSRMVS